LYKADKILIVGGGSAGWMTAATLIKAFPDRDITLVESANISKIGVGESTTAGLPAWLFGLGIDHEDFMQFTDAAYKLSIKFTDFHSIGDGGFHYPFGHPNVQNCIMPSANDWHVLKRLYPETTKQSYVDYLWPGSVLLESNKMYFPKNLEEMDGFTMHRDYAFQFNAIKFAQWLKERYAMPKGVKHIEADVVEIKTDDNGVSGVVLNDGTILEADLYVDCTGFKGMLIKEALGTPFESHAEKLPVNRTWAVQLPYENPEEEVVNYTNCTALGYGWVWNAPLYSRIGTGYVYSDKFTTPEEALEEFKEHLRKEKGAHRITDELTFRDIKFQSGIVSEPWNKNVVGIGLSTAFLEPLESNGLMFIHENASLLVRMIERSVVNRFDQETYNFEVKKHFNSFSAFIQLHYILSERRDTEFWKYMTSKRNMGDAFSREDAHTWVNEMDNKTINQGWRVSIDSGFNCIAVGHEWSPIGGLVMDQWKYHYPENDYNEIAELFKVKSEASRRKWWDVVKDAPSLYQFLKDNYHNEK
jgi:tryptophan halogenase